MFLGSTKRLSGLQHHLSILSVEDLPVRLEVLHWDLRSLQVVPASEWVLGIRGLFLTILLCHLQMGTCIHHLFVWSVFLSRWFFEDKFPMRPSFPILECLQPDFLFSKFTPRLMQKGKICWQNFLAKLMKSRQVSCRYRIIFNHRTKRNYWPFEWFSKSSFIRCFPISKEVLDISQIAISFHTIGPPPFIQSWRLFQRCHFSPIDEVLKCGDSMKNLHMLSQIPSSSLKIQLSVCAIAPRILTNFSPSRVKTSVYTDNMNPLSSKILHRRLSLDSYPSLKTLWSAVVKSPNFSARGGASPVRLLHGPLVILILKQTSQFRSFGKWVFILCILDFVATFVGCSGSDFGELCGCRNSVSFRVSLKSCNQ